MQRGFTLIELVTTLVLIGILSAVAVPRFVAGDDVFAQRGYTDEIAAMLRHARIVAAASQCEVRVVVNAANYSLAQRANVNACNSAASLWTTQVRRADGTAAAGTAPSAVVVTTPTTIVFDKQGQTQGAMATIRIGPFGIDVDQVSGAVRVTP